MIMWCNVCLVVTRCHAVSHIIIYIVIPIINVCRFGMLALSLIADNEKLYYLCRPAMAADKEIFVGVAAFNSISASVSG